MSPIVPLDDEFVSNLFVVDIPAGAAVQIIPERTRQKLWWIGAGDRIIGIHIIEEAHIEHHRSIGIHLQGIVGISVEVDAKGHVNGCHSFILGIEGTGGLQVNDCAGTGYIGKDV